MTTTPEDKADWIKDWTSPAAADRPAPEYRPPAWLQYAQDSVNDGDRALEDLPPVERGDGLRRLGPSDRIALAQAHYLRTIAVAVTEIAEHAEDVVEQLSCIDDALTLMIPKRRWTRLKFRR